MDRFSPVQSGRTLGQGLESIYQPDIILGVDLLVISSTLECLRRPLPNDERGRGVVGIDSPSPLVIPMAFPLLLLLLATADYGYLNLSKAT